MTRIGLLLLFGLVVGFSTIFITPLRATDLTSCALNGIDLFGEVEVVDSFPDLKVQVVDSFPDLKVELVDSFPDSCGQWKVVTGSGDFKVQYVDSFPDIKVQFVDSFPGLP